MLTRCNLAAQNLLYPGSSGYFILSILQHPRLSLCCFSHYCSCPIGSNSRLGVIGVKYLQNFLVKRHSNLTGEFFSRYSWDICSALYLAVFMWCLPCQRGGRQGEGKMNQVSHSQVSLCQTWHLTYFSSFCLLFGVLPLFSISRILIIFLYKHRHYY